MADAEKFLAGSMHRRDTSKFGKDEKPAVAKTEYRAPRHLRNKSDNDIGRYMAKSVVKDASDLLETKSQDNHSAYSVPFLSDGHRGLVPSLDFNFLKSKKTNVRRKLYKEVKRERKEKRELDPEDSSYTQSLEDEIQRSEMMMQSQNDDNAS